MSASAYGRSLIRTVVPILVGAVAGWLATRGVEIDQESIIPAIDAIIAAGYYAAVRGLEQRWPALGWLLGSPGAPSYASPQALEGSEGGLPDLRAGLDSGPSGGPLGGSGGPLG